LCRQVGFPTASSLQDTGRRKHCPGRSSPSRLFSERSRARRPVGSWALSLHYRYLHPRHTLPSWNSAILARAAGAACRPRRYVRDERRSRGLARGRALQSRVDERRAKSDRFRDCLTRVRSPHRLAGPTAPRRDAVGACWNGPEPLGLNRSGAKLANSHHEQGPQLEAPGNPTRLKVYRALVCAANDGLPVGRLQSKLDIAASTLSHHLHHWRARQDSNVWPPPSEGKGHPTLVTADGTE